MTRALFAGLLLSLGVACATPEPVVKPSATPVKVEAEPAKPYTMGIASYGGAEIAREDAEALQAYLTEKLGRPVTIRSFSMEWELGTTLAEGRLDFAWLPPFALLDAESKGTVKPLAKVLRHGLPYYRGVLFARSDRGIDSIQKLAGTTVAWVAKSSAAGYLFPRAALAQAGMKPSGLFIREVFLGDHTAVCKAVLSGQVDVGATFADDRPAGEPPQIDGCAQSVGPEQASKLRIITRSAPIPNDVIAVRSGLWPEEVQRIQQLFLKMGATDEDRRLLQKVFKAESFAEANGEELDSVRAAAEAAR